MRILISSMLLFLGVQVLAQTSTLRGTVHDEINHEAISFATVLIEETGQGTVTDDLGNFEITNVVPGIYTVRVEFLGYNDRLVTEIEIQANKPTVLSVEMVRVSEVLEEVTVEASAFERNVESPVSVHSVGVTEIKRNPGGNRDISRVIQSFPGVTSSSSFRNDLIIRGGAPNENRFYIDGIEIPVINHFTTQGASGGPAGMINIDFVRNVEFYSGGFPASRGNALSSVFDFSFKDGRTDRWGFTATIGASDIGVTAEGPTGEKSSLMLSARRSYLQLLFELIELPFLPTYNDFQFKWKYKPDINNEITFLGIGAIDNFVLNEKANETEEQQYLLDALPINNQWNYAIGVVHKHFFDNGYTELVLSRNMLNNDAYKYEGNDDSDDQNLIFDYHSQEIENKLRASRVWLLDGFRVSGGVEGQYNKYNNKTRSKNYTSSGFEIVNFESSIDFFRYGLFAQVSKSVFDERLGISFGLRMDGASYSSEFSNPLSFFSPRLSLSYALRPDLSINFNTGIYYQMPPYTILGYKDGETLVNKENNITMIRNSQIVAGISYLPNAKSKISVEAYFKDYDDYPLLLRDSISMANLGGDFGVIGNEPASPVSFGRTYGIELMFQQKLMKGYYGIAAYTFGRSEFSTKTGDVVPSAWDSRHIFSLTAGKRFRNNWEFGLKFRYQSGLPNTPDSEDSDLVLSWNVNNSAIPDYDRLNSLRSDPISGLDIRIDKKWFFPKLSIELYLDIQNLINLSLTEQVLILDRPLDENGTPIGDGVIVNPDDPINEQRYAVKYIETQNSTTIPTVGFVISF